AAMGVLQLALQVDDFTIAYLANNHSTATPFPFDIATAWAALEGSIVLWGVVLAGFTWVVVREYLGSPDGLGAGAVAVMGGVSVFFFGLMITVSNPFETCVAVAEGVNRCLESSPIPLVGAVGPADGAGPNPLLQNHLLMAVHPPMLYVGYVGLTVPFAYAMSALAQRISGPAWLDRSHRWTTVAWTFLTLGIVLGGWWAYEVLSWGGYWAWDPVENASFMPWLVATAFLHSALVQRRRGMLQSWNFVLVIGAFALTILGTFLTRSGTIASVHSFTQSAIGPVLLAFLVIVLIGSFGLFALRANDVAQPSRMESLSSREGAFLYNNLVLTVYAFVVLVGTLYPLFLEALTGSTVRVGEPFYNRLAVPLTFALLLGMGVGPVMPWRYARGELVWSRIHGPLQVALAAGAITVVTTTPIGWVVLAVVLATFVIAVILNYLRTQAQAAAVARSTSIRSEAVRLFRRDPGYWGGQLSHVGVAVIALGIAFAANLAVHDQVTMVPGDTVRFDGYEITYEAPFSRTEPNRTIVGARLSVTEAGEFVTTLEPRLNTFPNSAQAILTPSVHTTLTGDLYSTLRTIDPPTREIVLALDSSPMQWLVWLGGLLTGGGGLVALRGRRRKAAEVTASV
ncbi:MAG: heme lyase CcmF/NrfE family subunit, partial [Acidimicrobiia bacterium]|nr:heme lyase CcmF/NrfE family subunit [Acidimicrobiia bacterium]